MRFPPTLLEFRAQFPDDVDGWAYLRQARWSRGFVCPRCGGRIIWHWINGVDQRACVNFWKGCNYREGLI